MRIIIVTGMSGAGKSSVLNMLEDAGFFCVDNLPIPLLPELIRLTVKDNPQIDKAALGVDIRSGESLSRMEEILKELKSLGYKPEILFLDCSTPVLVKRYKETRRIHPLASAGRVDKGIELEREKLSSIRKRAEVIIDTSNLLIRELKAQIDSIYIKKEPYDNFMVTILSFGFKYGIPADADLVFDVRFLPNPFYIPNLKHKTGNDREVYDYVMNSEAAGIFLKQLKEMLLFLIPNYILEGKNQLVIGIGCTGGKHRSVTIANALAEELQKTDYGLKLEHRDCEKGL
ncbi:MAG: RNase adapter RapZ [Clostridiales bacterium]|nr:RNase adapter RapZ [Clostridiales bacterium]